ncbi:MAG: hypothetical protein JXR76_18950 [Deltaproteobacteria bacterium]|nr:hypothetical protein [Deltaproteobacteria bacterium]
MDVRKTIDLGNGHCIEIGTATWDDGEKQTSIRNRYPTAKGGFSPRSSSEIPRYDIKHITIAAADDNLLKIIEITEMIAALSDALSRKIREAGHWAKN